MGVAGAGSNRQSFLKNLIYLFHRIPKYHQGTIQIMELKYAQVGALCAHH